MTKYLINRILRGIFSVMIVVLVVMVLIYSLMNRDLIFAQDPVIKHMKHNAQETYKMQQWERYGYVDYIPYADWLVGLQKAGEIDSATYEVVAKIGNKESADTAEVKTYIDRFVSEMEADGYQIVRRNAVMKGSTKKYQEGGAPTLFAYRDVPLTTRLWNYITGLIKVDNIHNAEGIPDEERGLSFTWYDPVYGGEKFSPAIIGNGTTHKYLFYCTDEFPYIHQNIVNLSLGKSYTINKGIDVWDTMTDAQGAYEYSNVTYPTGLQENRADNLHSATYSKGSLEAGGEILQTRFVDDYTSVTTHKSGLSKMGYSFVIGILSVILAYLLAVPLGISMALKKDKLMDKLGTIYIVFIMAVPSLGYIFLFKAIGDEVGLPSTFDMQNPTWMMYILPIVSLALPSVANLMKWLRRYMIDQMNSDYVKFARSGGLSEGEIFRKHILKNAIIPIVHGVPGSVLGAMTGAIITERVYVVPGVGNVLTNAINAYDNGVIVGVTLFYATLSVISVILGDLLMSVVDPRISFSSKAR